MTKNQKWAVIILSFITFLSLLVAGVAFTSMYNLTSILEAPSATSRIDVDADIMLTATKDGKLELEYIHIHRIQGELNSKIVDLLILAAKGD